MQQTENFKYNLFLYIIDITLFKYRYKNIFCTTTRDIFLEKVSLYIYNYEENYESIIYY